MNARHYRRGPTARSCPRVECAGDGDVAGTLDLGGQTLTFHSGAGRQRPEHSGPASRGTASGKLVFAIFAALAEFERELIRERTLAGLASARARGRKGGHPHALSKAQVRLAQAAMAQRDTKVSELCLELLLIRKSAF